MFIFLFFITGCDPAGTEDILKNQSDVNSYVVSNSYFTAATYEPKTCTGVNSQGETTYWYVITCTSSCEVSLYEYSAVVKLYSSSNTLLKTQTVSEVDNFNAYLKFSFDVSVSREEQLNTACINVTFSGRSYEKPGEAEQSQNHFVTFVYNNGTASSKATVEDGKTVAMPNDPQKTNYIFGGWYIQGSFVDKYDFSKPITKNITLYAKFELDTETLTNKISTDVMNSVVKVYNKSYNTFLGFETTSYTVQGSGFCFHIQNGYYYILTNCHVAIKRESYDKQKFTIEDYQGNTYKGYLYKNPNKSVSAIAASYDLACLYFKPSSTHVKKLSIASSNPHPYDDVIALGAPSSKYSITYGTVCGYEKITLHNAPTSESNVTFSVIYHNAYTNKGSSGGPLLDANFNVVGVNYAGTSSGSEGDSIPAKRVKEFLKIYFYN